MLVFMQEEIERNCFNIGRGKFDSMSSTFKIVFLACFLIVPLAISWTEDDVDYFPADFTCADSSKQLFVFLLLFF